MAMVGTGPWHRSNGDRIDYGIAGGLRLFLENIYILD